MGENSKIEWTDDSWNPIRARRVLGDVTRIGWHCEHASPGCANCYSETMNKAGRSAFTGTRFPYKPGHRKDVEIFLDEKKLLEPLRRRAGRRIFVCSMTDLFAEFVTDEMLDKIFAVMALCPQHTFQVLTKRSARMREYVNDLRDSGRWLLFTHPVHGHPIFDPIVAQFDVMFRGIWLGVSVEDQQRADERREDLRNTPAAVKFVSYEPALEIVDWSGWEFLSWLISGSESGPKARPVHPDAFRGARDFCAEHGIAYFHKQNGEWLAWEPEQLPCWRSQAGGVMDRHALPDFNDADLKGWTDCCLYEGDDICVHQRVGKKAAGRLLDGLEHNGMPEVARG